MNNLCIFYTNHLTKFPNKYLTSGTDQDSIDCVHGLGEILRWYQSQYTVNRTVYKVPNIIVAYNKFMNNVDIVDQRRKATYTQRKERKIYMSFFTSS